ncbi:hypothetical protein [Klebsiella pneumoniae]|nr:hypothetical protein [Klebsiella pneumoniae]
MYEKLLEEFKDWLGLAKKEGIIRLIAPVCDRPAAMTTPFQSTQQS